MALCMRPWLWQSERVSECARGRVSKCAPFSKNTTFFVVVSFRVIWNVIIVRVYRIVFSIVWSQRTKWTWRTKRKKERKKRKKTDRQTAEKQVRLYVGSMARRNMCTFLSFLYYYFFVCVFVVDSSLCVAWGSESAGQYAIRAPVYHTYDEI